MQWVDITELRIAMAKRNMGTWKELVDESGISRKSLYNVINGKSIPTHESTYRIKKALRLSAEEYFKVFPEPIVLATKKGTTSL